MSHESARAARGSAAVMLAGVVEQAARLAVTATLARRLGPEGFGTYAIAIAVALALGTFSSLGQQPAVVRFGAMAGAGPARSAAFGTSLAIAAGGGLLASAALWSGADGSPAGDAMRAVAPGVALTAALYVVLGALRASGDVARAAAAHQLGLPLTMLALVWAWPVEVGALGATRMHVAATAVALGLAGAMALPRVGLAGFGAGDLRRHLSFGLPQGLAETLLRMAVWLDVIVLAALGRAEDVGPYRVAASLASLAAVPGMALAIAFSPIVAAGLPGRPAEVAHAARDLGRWTVSLAGAPLVVIWIAPEIVLWPFSDGYESSRGLLRVLLAGQIIQLVCAAAGPVVAMSGRPRLELINAVCAMGLALGLHVLLIPRFGGMGAAVASATGLGAWSMARAIEASVILGRPVLDRATLGLCALIVGLVAAGQAAGGSVSVAALAGALFAAAAWRVLPAERAWLKSRVARAFVISPPSA